MNVNGGKSIAILMIVSAVIIGFGTMNSIVVADPQNYKQGYKAGVHDALKDHELHQTKLHSLPNGEFTPWTRGYIDGFRATCPAIGLATGPDSPCELTMDKGTP